MRRLVAALVVVMAVTLSGCGGGGGGGGEAETPPATTGNQATPAADEEPAEPDRSPKEGQVYEAFPTAPDVLTTEIADKLDTDQPMIVYFFDSSQRTTNDQDDEVSAVLKEYRGLIDLVKYDVGKYVSTDASGAITVDEEALREGAEDETAIKVARLISVDYLDVGFTPYLVLVDSHGYITYRFRGPVDRDALEREVLRATQ
jgi:hypothetical protein